jgi:hypothetical protein
MRNANKNKMNGRFVMLQLDLGIFGPPKLVKSVGAVQD